MMPISSTAAIRALRPGLAKKARMICLYSTTATSAHSTRNTTIRTRKIRGDDSLVSSFSIAARGEGPEGIANDIRCGEPVFGLQYGTVAAGKKLALASIPPRNRQIAPLSQRWNEAPAWLTQRLQHLHQFA